MRKQQIVVGDTTARDLVGFGWDFEKWTREKQIPPEIRDDLLSRNSKDRRYFLARYHPSNPNILVRDLRQIDR